MIYSIRNLEGLNNQLFVNLIAMERWGTITDEKSFNQLTKQALNAIIVFFMAKKLEIVDRITIKWENFPRITLFTASKNCYATADVTARVINMTLAKAGKDESAMDEYTVKVSSNVFSHEFAAWMFEGVDTFEHSLYKAASKLATLVELEQIGSTDQEFKEKKRASIEKELDMFATVIPSMEFFRSEEFLRGIRYIAKLRYQNRWAIYPKNVNVSVLGHLFDTAVYANMISLEEKMPEKKATKAFFLGLFHDLAELITKDMPSPTKDGIPGYRKASEQVEEELMEKELYPLFPEYLANELRKMNFELPENAEFRAIIKGADYLSAASEIDRQVKAGTRYFGYLEALLGHENKFRSETAKLGRESRKLFKEICRSNFRILFPNVPKNKKWIMLFDFVDIMIS